MLASLKEGDPVNSSWQGRLISNGWQCYCQGHPISSGRDRVIDSVILSEVDVIVLLTGSPCQQWT